MAEALRGEIAAAVIALRARGPLVHGITGSATQGLVADGLLAAGARPMLTSTVSEAPTLVTVADALLVNLGSLSTDAREAIQPTVEAAQLHGVPWVLDPAAIGVAPARTPLAIELLKCAPTAVRGNASEILVLLDGGGSGLGGRGAESTASPDQAADAARKIAVAHGCVVAVSGPVDLVTDGERAVRVRSGHELLTRLSGTGCLLGALVAAHLAGVASDRAEGAPGGVRPIAAVVAATALLTVASEIAGAQASGPGSFRIGLLDALDRVSADEVATRVGVTWE